MNSPLDSASPTISVLMAVYNAERYLHETIDSILAQTFRDFEFLIADDGSGDRSLDILQTYAAQDSRIRVLTGPNQGVSRTRNKLIREAKGEFVAVMDADDIAYPDRFERQINFLQAHPQVVCVGGAHDVIDEQGRFLTFLMLPQTNEEVQQKALAGHGSICHPCAMMRRETLLKTGGYDEAYPSAHDLDLWLKLGELGELANLPHPLLKYRLHTQSVSGRNHVGQREEARQACEQAWKRRGIQGTFEATEPWRPGADRPSQHRFMLKYGWWAFNSAQRQTAILYGLRAIRLLPFNQEGWNLLRCALLKPMPQPK
jgi:glycosyltransferase involved in cell wall biosynthesis